LAHKKHKRKYLNILLIPDDESKPKNLKIRYSVLTIGITALVIVSVVLLVGIFTYSQLVEKAYENVSLRQENEQMQLQLQKINDLTEELTRLKAYGRKVQNSLTGYVKISESVDESPEEKAMEDQSGRSVVSILKSVPVKAPVVGFISQEFKKSLHNGVDIVAPEGTPVVAAANGTILFTGWTMDGGNTIIIGHEQGYYTYYKHNLRNVVIENQKVSQGEVIAYLGNSGLKSYGPHLHFEIWKDGHPLNPEELIVDFKK
jgi:murein DD-endopeptidase MepM/ murein hydrolase activator NlpD